MFLSEEEYDRCSQDSALVAEKADAFIRNLSNQLETVRAQADAASITAEQTCSLLEQKYVSLSSEFSKLESQNAQLNSSIDQRLSELAQVQAEKHQLHLTSIGKDGEIERLKAEASELQKSKRQLVELLEHKDLEISEKTATSKSYLDKIVNLTDNAASREARLHDIETELARSQAACSRLSQEKELIERHNVWLNDELTAKVDSQIELRKKHTEFEADMSSKLADVERKFNECSSSLNWNKERVRELETMLSSLQEELCSAKDAEAASEVRFSAEISTINKLVELYKESSEEWSRKAGELEGVIKALETHSCQVENDYKEKFEKEVSARKEFEQEAADLKKKLEKCEADLEASRKANELNILPLSSFTTDTWVNSFESNDMVGDNRMLVPRIPVGVSGTALAASLLRDGWSLAKMYGKYQEAIDALRHEQLGRKNSEAILQRVLYELEEKAEFILDERAEHERMVDAYSAINQKLQHSISEKANYEKSILELKAELRRHERDYNMAQKEIADLQKQVTVLLKECRDVQLRCGSSGHDYADDGLAIVAMETNGISDAEKVISERLLTFKDINGLVEQNVQLRSVVRTLSDQIENIELELKEKFDVESRKQTEEYASKVEDLLQRIDEQGRLVDSLKTSIAMYRRLYEEERKHHTSYPHTVEAASEGGSKDLMLLLEGPQKASTRVEEQSAERVSRLEEDLEKARGEIISIRSERDKLALEANFARDKLNMYMKDIDHQRGETDDIRSRNVEFSQLIVGYQQKLRESSESLHAAEELSRKLTMEVSVLKLGNEMLSNAEKRAYDEVRSLSERVHRLQASLDTIQSAEEVRKEARVAERRKQEQHIEHVEREWAEAKRQLQEERDNLRSLIHDREQTIKNAMRQVEEKGNELADALRAVATAEARAAVAEARCSDMEWKLKSLDSKAVDMDGGSGFSSFASDDVAAELRSAKEEMEKLRDEAQANKDHMLQYKSIAEVNEDALKQMESAHENFKIEADRLKESLEMELSTLRERVSELQNESSLKFEEAAFRAAGKEEALGSALSEITRLKEESSVKMSQIVGMEIQISSLKDDLAREHQRWRTAHANYERQVILQSDTIQELTKTSQDLALLQEEASKLRKLADSYKNENDELKSRWGTEKLALEDLKNEAERKYNEINEQNKILHSRLEALHIQLAEKDRISAGLSSGSTSSDPNGDSGLQNVVSYLRRSKEIAETEISLLKQEKLRLQSQLESALKASETAQSALHAERTNSRAALFTEDEIKSLQFQVREMNLLRESNMQLREENKNNFEECQKLLELAQKSRVETQNLERQLKERQIEVEVLKKEIETQRMEKSSQEKNVAELLEKCKNIDVEDYERMKDEVRQMQVNLGERDALMEETKKLVSEKQDIISKLEQDIANSRVELNEKEKRINDNLNTESKLKTELEKQKRAFALLKRRSTHDKEEEQRRFDTLSKEKEELIKENQTLSKQLEDLKQVKKSMGEATAEQAMKEREEKDARIQILEKTVEKQRDDNRKEVAKRQKTERAIMEKVDLVNQDKMKIVDELEKHKQAVKKLSDEVEKLKLDVKKLSEEVEKLKQVKSNLPEATSTVQLLSGTALDDLASSFVQASEHFERVAQSLFAELGGRAFPSLISSTVETSSSSPAPAPAPAQVVPTITSSAPSPAKGIVPKPTIETRKTGRKLIRPRLVADTEMSETEISNTQLPPPPSSQDTEASQSRKRLAASSSAPELNEGLLPIQGETIADMAMPALKKLKGSESPKEEAQTSAPSENLETLPSIEESIDAIADLQEAIDAEKEEAEAEELKESQPLDVLTQLDEVENDQNIVLEEEMAIDDVSKDQAEKDAEDDMEEGELAPDGADVDDSMEMGEGQVEPTGVDDEANFPEEDKPDEGEIGEDGGIGLDKSNDVNDLNDQNSEDLVAGDPTSVPVQEESVPTTSVTTAEVPVQEEGATTAEVAIQEEGVTTAEVAVQEEGVTTADVTVQEEGVTTAEVAVQEERVITRSEGSGRIVNLQKRAKEKAVLRQAQMSGQMSSPPAQPSGQISPPPNRGRGRMLPTRGRVTQRRGRGRGGQSG